MKKAEVVKVEINPVEYGLTATEAKTVEKAFQPMLKKMNELEDKYNSIIQGELTPDLIKEARELRLEYVKVRTGTDKIHKEAKAYYLAGGRFVDGWKNAQVFISQGKEKSLSDIENHFENIEKERLEGLKIERADRLYQIGYKDPVSGLELMENEIFEGFVKGIKIQIEEKLALEAKLAKEKEEAEFKEKTFYNRKIEIARFGSLAPYQPFMDMSQDDFLELLGKCEKEKESFDALEKIEKENQQAILKEEREKRERAETLLEDQRKAKELEDQKKAEFEAKNNAKNELELIEDLKKEFNLVVKKYLPKFKNEENLTMISNVAKLIAKVNVFIDEKKSQND
jgi:hypothetical protein